MIRDDERVDRECLRFKSDQKYKGCFVNESPHVSVLALALRIVVLVQGLGLEPVLGLGVVGKKDS